MAKPLHEKIAAALKTGARLADVRSLIDEVESAISEHEFEAARAQSASTDPLAPPNAAETERQTAERLNFAIDRLRTALTMLMEKRDAMQSDERAAELAGRQASARLGRDELAAELAEWYPRWVDQYIAMMQRLDESDAEMARASIPLHQEPRAESLARGLGNNFMPPMSSGGGFALELRKINLPNFRKAEILWPPSQWSERPDLRPAAVAMFVDPPRLAQ